MRPGDQLRWRRATRRAGAARAGPDARALERALRKALAGEVLFDDGNRALFATDASNYRYLPIGVVRPRSIQDVMETVRLCRQHGAPVLSRGGGTSLAGQCTNVAVVIDWTRHLGGVVSIDPVARTARVLPGTVLDELRGRAIREHRLTFGPDPATHTHCTLGGMIGNNSCGVHAQMAGCTAANVVELDVLTSDGARFKVGRTGEEELRRIMAEGGRRAEIYRGLLALRDRYGDEVRRRYPRIPRRVSGYNLDALLPEHGMDVARALVGSEGTLVTILEATVRLVPEPRHRALLLAGFEDVASAGDAVPVLLPHRPIGLEGLDDLLVDLVRRFAEQFHHQSLDPSALHAQALEQLPPGRGFLMVEFGGDTRDQAEGRARAALAELTREAKVLGSRLYGSREEAEGMWKVRESGLGATARVPGGRDTFPGWEDSAVPPDRVGEYLRALQEMFRRYDYHASLYGHFGQGCVHCSIDFVLHTREGLERYRRFVTEAAELVSRMGGSLSGEHGDGQSRAELLPIMFGPELVRAFREYKRLWDPEGLMNPGRIVGAPPLDDVASLRVGPAYQPRTPPTHFRFPDDGGHFFRAAERCVGVGECRRAAGAGTMCPSYVATREEKHSTRGRAHLLFELMRGELVGRRGWRDRAVKQSLDLCLSCKGCKGDCPVSVDVATYKAEFLAHYHRGRLRPRAAYAMGLVMAWARAAALAPGVVNLLGRAPGLSRLVKAVAGIAKERSLPRFAKETFQRWLARRGARRAWARADAIATRRGPSRGRVLLWPDTFNNHFFPETARAALELLEEEGFQVVVPRQALCCGRPLYDFGMLPTAKRLLQRTMRVLAKEIDAGTPILVLEPSCASVFRDELRGLFPDDERARRLREQVVLFAELMERENIQLPPLDRDALLHGHCHQKSLFKLESEQRLLQRLGVRAQVPEAGCCGMAGAFGFERGEKHRISMTLGERALLPAVRAAPARTLLVADGFSCREQVAQGTGRRPLHVAEVAWMARHRAAEPSRALACAPPPLRRLLRSAAAVAAVAAGVGLWRARRWRG
ncbi:MAG TPA: FAD-binding and (Fe-S)-binding domain-containing protein [Myxococcales bacterium]|nr:FAD-binding and (Fe-S)-binding domain-containing protein [Myxococcales bacterium]